MPDSFVNNTDCSSEFVCKIASLENITTTIFESCNVNQLYIIGNVSTELSSSNYYTEQIEIEELNVTLSQEGDDYYLDGRLPWVTNLRSDKFAALFAADFKDGSQPWIITIPSEAEGLSRSEDLEFVSLQGANTASLTFDHVKLDPNWVLSKEGTDYIAKTRPNFLGFQFGLAFGLAQRSLDEVEASLNSNRSVLREEF